MIIDGRSVPARSTLPADLCVVGAGAVGITLALALAGWKGRIIILESGGFEPDTASQDLMRGTVVGQKYAPIEATHMRCFGGSTMHWGGWCRPFEPIDFEARPWVPHSGWPIGYDDVARYYPRAQELCQLGAFGYEPSDWQLPPNALLPLAGGRMRTRFIQFSPPTRFGVRYRDEITRSTDTVVYLNSTAQSLLANREGRSIQGIRVVTPAGNTFDVVAKRYVVAAGGIDTPRLLLASRDVMPAGIGNDNDLVGRFFAEHMQLDSAGLLAAAGPLNLPLYQSSARSISHPSTHPGGRRANLMAYLSLEPAVQRERRTLNYSANVLETTWESYFFTEDDPEAGGSVASGFMRSLGELWDTLSDAITSRARGSRPPVYKIVTTQEQAPNPASRVRLSSERDALGMPRPILEWRFTDLDRFTLAVGLEEIVRATGSGGTARIHGPIDVMKEGLPNETLFSWHHSGTTRMSHDPKQGVTDPHGRVHGLANLYVGGSSVFPTNGHGNPTLTVVAMALRLADHLRSLQ